MTLTAEQIRALAPAPGYRQIDRYMPDPYRRALGDTRTPLAVLTKSWRDGLKRLDHELGLVQRSRSVRFFSDLDDGGRLGALHDQVPWEEEDTEAFRIRLAEIARIAAQGAASARRMLSLVALATGSEIVDVIPPDRTDHAVSHGETTITVSTGQGQTRGYLVKPDRPGEDGAPDVPGELFAADVIDAPNRLFTETAELLPGPNYMFRLHNTASATLPDILGDGERTYPYPIFRLEAGENIGPLMLIQTFNDPPRRAPRAIVINRRLRAGSVLDVNVEQMAWNHDEGTATLIGPWRLDGDREALYGGLTEIAIPSARFDNEPGDPAAGYALRLLGSDGLDFNGTLKDEMIDQGTIPDDGIQMPSLLGQGTSLWRVVRILPDPEGSNEIHDARFEPLPRGVDLRITARWSGRRAGEFAVVVGDPYLAIDTNGPLPHRHAWLDEVITRFKLAGTVRVQPLLEDLFAGQSDEAIQVNLETRASFEISVDIDNWGELASVASISDSFELFTERTIEFDTVVEADTSASIVNEGVILEMDEPLVLADVVEVFPESRTGLETSVRLRDEFTLTIEEPVNPGRVGPIRGDPVLGPVPVRPRPITGPISPVSPVTRTRPLGAPVSESQEPIVFNFTDRIRVRDSISLRRPRNR